MKRTLLFAGLLGASFLAAAEADNVVFNPGDGWKAADLQAIRIQPGSALDFSGFLEPGPAGKHGRALVGETGALVFEKQPGVPRRLYGFAAGYWGLYALLNDRRAGVSKEEEIAEYVRQVRLAGYDFIRFFSLLGGMTVRTPEKNDGKLDEAKLALAELFYAECKKQGVYLYLDVSLDLNTVAKAQVMVGVEAARKRWMESADLLTRVNPHTGLALKDDPALMGVMLYNEQSTGSKIAMTAGLARLDDETRDAYTARWRQYLTKKYGTPEKLAAWNEPLLQGKADFSAVPLVNFQDDRPIAGEFHLFLTELSLECDAWCESYLRRIGYRGLVSNYNSNPDLGASGVRWQRSGFVSHNTHNAHPTGPGFQPGGRCPQVSSIEDLARSWNYAACWRFADRPIVISELSHAFWNRYRYEGGLVYPAYAAFNHFGALLWHADYVDVAETPKWPRGGADVFRGANSPLARANAALAFFLFRRGDVQPAKHRVELVFSNDFLNKNSKHSPNTLQRRISMLTGFTIAFPELPVPPGTPEVAKADIRLAPGSGAEVIDGEAFSVSKESAKSEFTLEAFVPELKKRGILAKENRTDPANDVYQNESGEITLYGKQKLFTVITPRTEAAALTAGNGEKLGLLAIQKSTVNAAVSASSLDGKPLSESGRMLLLYITREANTGMEVSADEVTMVKRGKGPLLLQTGRLEATLKKKGVFKLYALGADGSRREELPLTVKGDGLEIRVDTALLKDGPTPFFELVSGTSTAVPPASS